ncbi:MAG: signal recognition particle-docking protein FtsY, partial [Nitrosopumilaceae archaeon]
MFEKLRNTFAKTAKSFSEKELREKDIDDILSELEISLMESDVATEVIDSLKSELKQKLVGEKVEKKRIEETVKQSLVRYISDLFDSTPKIDLLSNVSSKKNSGEPYIILFVGINGTGKTTTLAKVAHMLQRNKFSVVVAAADTYRAGAIEQLRVHTDRLNLKLIAQNYGSDPAAVSRDAVLYAKSHKVDCILIDSAGRMQTSKNLMDQISKINKVVNPDLKIFVGDSLAGNDTVNQAREFYQYVKFDGAILTKSDADARGGSAISIVKVTSAPILY